MATGDSRLSNTARLLAAQEFNRRQVSKEAAERLAKVEADRQKELNRRFDRQREALAKQTAGQSAQVAAFQKKRLEDDIKKQQNTAKEQARVKEINQVAEFKAKKAVRRSLPITWNSEVTVGRLAVRDNKGAIVGFSDQEDASAKKAKRQIVQEIQRREVERTKVTDLERFLQNEQRLARGDISTGELRKQIADRKKRGLSKTPQQKRLLQQRSDEDLDKALRKRGGTVNSIAQLKAEGERSRAKKKENFGVIQNKNFISAGGSSFQARARDSSAAQINSQLALLQRKRTTKSSSASHNERVALQIASGNFFKNLSDTQLGDIFSGGQGLNAPKAQSAAEQKRGGARSIFGSNKGIGNIRDTLNRGVRDEAIAGDRKRGQLAQNLNTFSPFAIRAQQDIPDPVTGVTDRDVQLFRRQLIEDNKDRPIDKQERVPDTSEFFTGGRAPRADDPFNDFVFGSFGGVDTTKLDVEGGDIANPNAVDESLLFGGKDARGGFASSIFSDTQTKADIAGARKEANKNKLVQRQTDLGAISRSLLAKNTARGKAIEQQNREAPPRFSLNLGVTVQANKAQAPTQLSLIPQRIKIGATGVTKDSETGKFFSASGKELKGRALVIAKQQDTSQSFGLSSSQTGQPLSALQVQQSKADRKREEALFNTTQNQQAREQGGFSIPSADFSSLSLGNLDPFQQGRSTSGLVKAGGSANKTQTFGGEPIARFQEPRNLSESLSENLFFDDQFNTGQKTKAKTGTTQTKKPTTTTKNGLTIKQVQGGTIVTSNTPSKPRKFAVNQQGGIPKPPATPFGVSGEAQQIDFGFGGVGEALGQVSEGAKSTVKSAQAFANLFSQAQGSGAFDLGSPFGNNNKPSSSIFDNLSIDPNFDPAEQGRKQALRI